MTGTQRAILQAVREHPHQTADHIYTEVKKGNSRVALGTVYRNLNSFSERNIIKRIHRGDAPDLYDPTIAPHEHMICLKCGKAKDIKLEGFEELINENVDKRIEFFELLLYYVCAKCE